MNLFFAFTALLAATAAEELTACDEAQDFIARAYEGEEDEALEALSEEHGDEWEYIRGVCAELCTAEDKGDCDEYFDGRYEAEMMMDELLTCSDMREWVLEAQAGMHPEEVNDYIEEHGSEDAMWAAAEDFCSDICAGEGREDCSDLFEGENEGPTCAEVEGFITNLRAGDAEETAQLDGWIEEMGEEAAWEMIEDYCVAACGASTCNKYFSDAEACSEAQKKLADSTNDLQKIGLRITCENACANVDGETCGFLINGLSFVLFTILAIFKY